MTPLKEFFNAVTDLPIDLNTKFKIYKLATDMAYKSWENGFQEHKKLQNEQDKKIDNLLNLN